MMWIYDTLLRFKRSVHSVDKYSNKKLVYSIVLNVALCIIYAICVDQVNSYKPIEWNISMGITFRLSIIVLSIALFLEMWIIFYVHRKYIYWLPILIPVSYWVNYCNLFPYRFIVFIVLNIVVYLIYTVAIIYITKYLK